VGGLYKSYSQRHGLVFSEYENSMFLRNVGIIYGAVRCHIAEDSRRNNHILSARYLSKYVANHTSDHCNHTTCQVSVDGVVITLRAGRPRNEGSIPGGEQQIYVFS
jgi:hypothetical protein